MLRKTSQIQQLPRGLRENRVWWSDSVNTVWSQADCIYLFAVPCIPRLLTVRHCPRDSSERTRACIFMLKINSWQIWKLISQPLTVCCIIQHGINDTSCRCSYCLSVSESAAVSSLATEGLFLSPCRQIVNWENNPDKNYRWNLLSFGTLL